jgi:hypothetical protein
VEGDEEEGGEMDDLEEEFQMKKPHEPVAFDVYSVSSFFFIAILVCVANVLL